LEGSRVPLEPESFQPLPDSLHGPLFPMPRNYDILTTSLPLFEPSNTLFIARGALRSPSTTFRRYRIFPALCQARMASIASDARSRHVEARESFHLGALEHEIKQIMGPRRESQRPANIVVYRHHAADDNPRSRIEDAQHVL